MSQPTISQDQILNSDYLDIIYNGHNKKYGGYQLRKNYSRRVMSSVFILFGVGIIISGYGLLFADTKHEERVTIFDKGNVISDIKPLQRQILPPPPAPKMPKAATQRSTPLVIAHNDQVENIDPPTENKNITNPGAATTAGTPGDPEILPTSGQGGSGPVTPPPPPLPQKPHEYVDQMPRPDYDYEAYLGKSLHYPDQAREAGVQGRVVIKFVVNEDGSISDVVLIRGIGAGCDEEAKRVIAAMPAWKPGKLNGIPVKVYYCIPINFKLQ